jgi:hypothetical protein
MEAGNGTMRMDTQFSVFLANKPGVLAQVCRQLADDKVNIVAMCLMDSTEHGVLRLVTADMSQTRQALKALNVPTSESKVIVATLPNRPGALSDVVERLGANHVSVNYAYVTTGAPGGKTIGILSVSDPTKATKVLSERSARRRSDGGGNRTASPARRR